MSDFKAKMHQNPKFGWAPPQTPLGSLQRSPSPLAGFKGRISKGRGGEWRREEGMGQFSSDVVSTMITQPSIWYCMS